MQSATQNPFKRLTIGLLLTLIVSLPLCADGYRVCIASFRNAENAERIKAELDAYGIRTSYETADTAEGLFIRLFMQRSFATLAEAELALSSLRNHPVLVYNNIRGSWIVPPATASGPVQPPTEQRAQLAPSPQDEHPQDEHPAIGALSAIVGEEDTDPVPLASEPHRVQPDHTGGLDAASLPQAELVDPEAVERPEGRPASQETAIELPSPEPDSLPEQTSQEAPQETTPQEDMEAESAEVQDETVGVQDEAAEVQDETAEVQDGAVEILDEVVEALDETADEAALEEEPAEEATEMAEEPIEEPTEEATELTDPSVQPEWPGRMIFAATPIPIRNEHTVRLQDNFTRPDPVFARIYFDGALGPVEAGGLWHELWINGELFNRSTFREIPGPDWDQVQLWLNREVYWQDMLGLPSGEHRIEILVGKTEGPLETVLAGGGFIYLVD